MAYFLQKLEAYKDETGSVLDNSAVVWMNTMSNGNGHVSSDMPVVMAGSLGGFFKTGSYVYVGDSATVRKPHNMLLTTLMNGMGVPETHFGPKDIGRAGQLEQLKV